MFISRDFHICYIFFYIRPINPADIHFVKFTKIHILNSNTRYQVSLTFSLLFWVWFPSVLCNLKQIVCGRNNMYKCNLWIDIFFIKKRLQWDEFCMNNGIELIMYLLSIKNFSVGIEYLGECSIYELYIWNFVSNYADYLNFSFYTRKNWNVRKWYGYISSHISIRRHKRRSALINHKLNYS